MKSRRTISGSVRGPNDFHGVIFLGLFFTATPPRRPINGSVLLHQGRFELPLVRGQPRLFNGSWVSTRNRPAPVPASSN
jgi:hypothetical protein